MLLFTLKCIDRFSGPASYSRYTGIFFVEFQFHLMQWLRMNGAPHPRRNVPSCKEEGTLYILYVCFSDNTVGDVSADV